MRMASAAIAVAAAAAAVLLAPSAPASASPSDCPRTYLCFWENHHYSGRMGRVADNRPDYRKMSTPATNCGGTWDNCASSVYNNGTQCTVYLFRGYNYTGTYHTLSIGDAENIPEWDASFNDDLSSNRWCSRR